MFGFLFFASTAVSVIPQDIYAERASLTAATRGMVRDDIPRLDYDLAAVAAWQDGQRPSFRLSYATHDELSEATESRDLLIAQGLAAELIRGEDGDGIEPR